MLYLSQQQRLQQKLSPQQIQYIKLLQLPQLALEQAIKAELEVNPALEEGSEDEVDSVEPEIEILAPEPEVADADKLSTEAKKTEDVSIDDLIPQSKSNDEEFSWEDYISEDDLYGYKSGESSNYSEDDDRPDNTPAYIDNLTEKIREQMALLNFSEKQIQIGEQLLGSMDPDGYLRIENARILDDIFFNFNLHVTDAELESVRKEIMTLDPVGICSRSLQECLICQLQNMELSFEVEDALLILSECFEEFTKKHFDAIMRKTGFDEEQLREAFQVIKRLNPKPGDGDFTANENYITPDFFVLYETANRKKIKGEIDHTDEGSFQIFLNDKGIPSLKINKKYVAMASAKNSKLDEESRSFIKKKVEDAKFFRQSIMQRRETMTKVMETIVDIQGEFFKTGAGLRPMILKDVADRILMDISTVSRVVNSKYVQTEFGVYSLKHFFSEGIETDTGEDASSKEVKIKLKEIIDNEDGKKPLSDDKIAEMLQDKGLTIARRTVTKYREAMNIPVARLRKKI